MADEQTGITLDLHLWGPGASLPAGGTELTCVEPLRAQLRLGDSGATVDVVLAERDRADLRWAVDGVLRRVRGLAKIGPVRLHAAEGVDDDTVLTLALDQHDASEGRVTLADRGGLGGRLARLGGAEDLYRTWVNEDPTVRTSKQIAADVRAWGAGRDDVEVTVLDQSALEAEGLRLLLAVGQASEISPPRLVVARYTPAQARGERWMLVGKGITFDSGGINVKPYESFVSMMKNDMGGAALAYATFKALVEGGARRPLTLVLPTCENPIGEGAMRPGSIVTGYGGQRVRIDHTDAEGRLILADALAWATEREQPERVLTFATLTTAALIAYGPYATPVHFAPPALERALARASERMGEDLHFFPERLWHREANRDVEADVKNTGRLPKHAVRAAGSRNAAHFLTYFTDAPLTHFDIFASTWNWAGDAPGAGVGATGAPLRTLLAALEDENAQV